MRGRLSFQLAVTPDVRRSEAAANSLFQNILRVTRLDPIFCKHTCISPARNLPEFNILRTSIQKTRKHSHRSSPSHQTVRMHGKPSFQPSVRRSEPAANSLFQNILRVTRVDPIFCEHETVSPARNLPEFNILRTSIQKLRSCPDPQITSATPRRGTRLFTRHRPAQPLPSGSKSAAGSSLQSLRFGDLSQSANRSDPESQRPATNDQRPTRGV